MILPRGKIMKTRAFFVAAAMTLVAACTQQPAQLTEAQLVERGSYIVNSVGLCNDCHTPMTPQGPDMSKALQGGPVAMQLVPGIDVPWASVAPSIAGLPAGYTEEQFVHFLQTGERVDGSQPRAPMPPYRLNEEDARAVAAYIKTVPRAPEQ
jgi:mono/diheme cytochrome c family protein